MYNVSGHVCVVTDRIAVRVADIIDDALPDKMWLYHSRAIDAGVEPWFEVSVVQRDPIIMTWGDIILANGAHLGYTDIEDVIIYVSREEYEQAVRRRQSYGEKYIVEKP